ncbi:polysaccharide export protein [Nitrincola sp.]|uniref:polysaccharide export protein n=1 Tax=Nitrincola sp. TaxID=1926584 RepID=UPI003A935E90
MRFIQSLVAAVVCSATLGGCAVPGSHISSDNTSSNYFFADESEQAGEQFDLTQLEVKAITPQLIIELTPSAAGAQGRVNPQLDQALQNYDYVVGNGDVLNITVWDHPELTIPAGSYRSAQDAGNWVHNDGTIFYPYVGKVKVSGLNVTEIRHIIAKRLRKYIENPQVDVSVAAFRSQRIYVTGEVNKPGTQAITNVPLTLLDAVNAASGLSDKADWSHVVLTRQGNTQQVSLRELYERGDISQNMLLRHNDVIHVNRNDYQKVFVLGEVAEPAKVQIDRAGISLAEALTDVGGLNEGSADASGVFVIRAEARKSDNDVIASVYQMDLRDARAMVLADQFPLQARDVVYVTGAPLTRWNRVVQQLMPTIQAVYWTSNTYNELDPNR